MDHMEMVEKLRAKANVSYEDAKAALEVSDWDLLDALVILEREGKLAREESASYTTKRETKPQSPKVDSSTKGVIARLFEMLASLINRMNKISLDLYRKGKKISSLPLIAFVLMLLFMFWWTIPTMVISLFFGVSYRFSGSSAVEGVNKVMDKASDMAENIKTGAGSSQNDSHGDV
jgi:hypothetical protein